MTNELPKRRRWFQFRLRTLFIAILVLSLPLSWFAVRLEKARRQREAVKVIRQLGGEVIYHWEPPSPGIQCLMEVEEPRTPEWICRLLGKEFSDVMAVSLWGQGVQESDLSVLQEFPNLRGLEITGTPIGDVGIDHIAGLTKLEALILDRTGITPEDEKKLHAVLPANTIVLVYPGTNDAPQPLSR